jgi:hypothetical protein
MEIFEVLVARMAPKEVELGPQHSHGVSISRHGNSPGNLRGDPGHGVHIEDVYVVEALLSIVASEHVELSAHARHSVTGSGGGLLPADLGLAPDKA